VKGQGHQGQKTCLALFSPPSSIRKVCARCQQHAAAVDSTIASLPRADFGGLHAVYVWQNVFSWS